MSRRVVRGVAGAALAVEAVLLGCRAAGVRTPGAVLAGAAALVACAMAVECVVLGRLWLAARRAGAGRRAAVGAVVRTAVPGPVRRLVAHEARALSSLGLWVLRRRHGVPGGALAVPYTGP
ncbi:hypothetical protein [Streptomyces sp. NPDC014622]|uniref:hypothetical protein n=1 Tax=Streptomyces sp. NPDC014622 TaxID=3364874 RepID=UPI0037013FE2